MAFSTFYKGSLRIIQNIKVNVQYSWQLILFISITGITDKLSTKVIGETRGCQTRRFNNINCALLAYPSRLNFPDRSALKEFSSRISYTKKESKAFDSKASVIVIRTSVSKGSHLLASES